MDADRFVFLDETGASTKMVRRSGWGPKGERLVDAVPHGHWRTTTFVAGLRASGIIAPFVLDGPMTGEAFRAYVEQVLAPELEPGDAVVMDNLRPHKVAGVREAIRAAGASVLYLPSYSPDLNPIEQLFAKLKELLRNAAARTKEALWDAIGRHRDDFTPEECQTYLAHCGYELSGRLRQKCSRKRLTAPLDLHSRPRPPRAVGMPRWFLHIRPAPIRPG